MVTVCVTCPLEANDAGQLYLPDVPDLSQAYFSDPGLTFPGGPFVSRVGPLLCQPVENRSRCHTLSVRVTMECKVFLQADVGTERAVIKPRISLDGGTVFIDGSECGFAPASGAGAPSTLDYSPREHIHFSFMRQAVILAPLESRTICSDLVGDVDGGVNVSFTDLNLVMSVTGTYAYTTLP